MKKINRSIFALAVLAFAFAFAGCAAFRSPEAQAELAKQARRIVGTDELSAKFDAAEERADLAFAFAALTAEKNGISETDARDYLAGRTRPDEGEEGEDVPADVDAIDFASLAWKFGGVDGSKAKLSSPRISGLKASANGISYKWDVGMSGWGLAHDQTGALVCWFVEKEDGSIVGGKFDWISTSRTTRDFKNINTGYQGWNLDGVPNPCKAYMVVITEDCRKRSNVIGTEWKR